MSCRVRLEWPVSGYYPVGRLIAKPPLNVVLVKGSVFSQSSRITGGCSKVHSGVSEVH